MMGDGKLKELELNNSTFENIKHLDEVGVEYWEARELMLVLEYKRWDKFKNVINAAITACRESNNCIEDHFSQVGKMVKIGSNTRRIINDYKLSRYACYLIVQNADSKKKTVALGQTYFAIQTRRQELSEKEFNLLTEDEKRFYRRKQTKDGNKVLYKIASAKGVKNFDKFTNAGYMGLYNGETADDIAKRKGLRYREEILDNMSSAELVSNIFRISQTEELLKKQIESSEKKATDTHYFVGKTIRKAIKELGGTMPEDYPTPNKSLKELEKGNNKLIK